MGPGLGREDGPTGDSWPNLTSPRAPVDTAREIIIIFFKVAAARRSALGRFRGEKQMPPRGNWQTLVSFFEGGGGGPHKSSLIASAITYLSEKV